MLITKEFTFDSAHYLTEYRGKCENMHGHTYKLHVTLNGDVQKNGLVIDFVILKRIVTKHVLDKLDHKTLNEVVSNPSAENLAKWIWDELEDFEALVASEADDPNLKHEIEGARKVKLYEIKLWESPTAWVTYKKDA